jgi:hypothetical protein
MKKYNPINKKIRYLKAEIRVLKRARKVLNPSDELEFLYLKSSIDILDRYLKMAKEALADLKRSH